MIKMLCQVPRQRGMSEKTFFPRYREGHGGLVLSHARAMGFLRYIQAHRIASEELDAIIADRGWRGPLDGQSELWWDSWESMEAALSSPEGAMASAMLEADEKAFTDTVNVSGFIARELLIHEVPDGMRAGSNSAIKLVIDLWAKPGDDPTDTSVRWRNDHSAKGRQLAIEMGCIKFVRNDCDPEAKFDFADLRGWQRAPDCVLELWWSGEKAMRKAISSMHPRSALASLISELDIATDPSLNRAFIAREHIVFDYVADLAPPA